MIAAIRNFAIIAHIDHGKTTLTDQLLRRTATISRSQAGARILDSHPIEKERGITIKLALVTMSYTRQATSYQLNLIDTPGHVDFAYEVSRSLAACEGALLLVDATQGIQAQTLAHGKTAIELGLKLLPAINKIDLPQAQIRETKRELQESFGFREEEIALVSAKTGEGVDELIARLVSDLPPPKGDATGSARSLVFNSIFDPHRGVIAFVRVFAGQLTMGRRYHLINAKAEIVSKEVGMLAPDPRPLPQLSAGEVGYLTTGLKDVQSLQVGETIADEETTRPLPGFKLPKPVVFIDIFPSGGTDFDELKRAIEQLRLTDAALTLKPVHSRSLGGGFRMGCLGMFHAEISKERLEQEYGVATLMTQPTVEYTVLSKQGEPLTVSHPSDLPNPETIEAILEPMVKLLVMTPKTYLGALLELLESRRGTFLDLRYLGDNTQLLYQIPFAEFTTGLSDAVKSASQGYASFEYQHQSPQPVEAVKLTIFVNREEVEPLGRIVLRDQAQRLGQELVERVKQVLPRELFPLPIQAAIGNKVIARATLPALRKDVTAKLYGGDRTRRMKLLTKQRQGKRRLSRLGRVSISPETIVKLSRLGPLDIT